MKLLLWMAYYPLFKIVSMFVFWIPAYQERSRFEKQNCLEPLCESFKLTGLTADLCFEFSSEGEYQQVASLIDDALKAGKRIELVFFSPSVEKAIVNLARNHQSQIRYLRYPLIRFSPFGNGRCFSSWITSKKLIMVRYDLFPEFLSWAGEADNELVMLWMSFKKERVKQKNISWMKKKFLSRSSKIVYASLPDQELGMQLGFPGSCYDFRMEQIKRRVALKESKFASMFVQYQELKANWESIPPHKRLIIGNVWPSDLFLFELLPKDVFVLVVPHKLTPEILKAMHEGLTRTGRSVIEISDGSTVKSGDTFILNKKGVLCELYADFGLAYVGGGFEAGVHSILEPLVAGSETIACGEAHHRSTEYDVARGFGRMTEVKTPQAFLEWLTKDHIVPGEKSLSLVFEKYEKYRKDVISC
ncbi:MAG TPA: hypothetical protein VNJ08_09885 [Bacteriovoracaceae bacterium]|nr:hypothetical protein [Bacteriovoracaceae bacterium]